MPKTRPPYDPEFRQRILARAPRHLPNPRVARPATPDRRADQRWSSDGYGSHNIGSAANDTNDEFLVKLAAEPESSDANTRPIYNAFYGHFYDAYDSGTDL